MCSSRRITLGLLGAFLTASSASAQLQLPSLIGDHMVFQSGKPLVVWGKDQPGQTVTVSMAGRSNWTKAGADGNWKTSLPALPPGGPTELTIAGSTTIIVKDVLVGEVWLGSGQSNMEFRMNQLRDRGVVFQATDSQIRLFLQKPIMSAQPLDQPVGEWKVCSPTSVADFSAVAYYFGRDLRQKLNVPVGLIDASWGGSYAESWTPKAVLKSDPAFNLVWGRWNKIPFAERKGWFKGRFPVDFAVRNIRWTSKDPSHLPPGPQTGGQALVVPSQGADDNGGTKEGSAQKPLTVEAKAVSTVLADAGKPGVWGTSVKEGSDIFISLSSGVPRMTGSFLTDAWGFMTTHLGPEGKSLDLSAYDALEFDAKGDGNYILFLSQPSITDWDNYRTPDTFPVSKEWKHYRIPLSSLKQSGWGKPQPLTPNAITNISFGVDPKALIEIPSAIYNGMINPLTYFPIKGVIWYQGEANTIYASEYSHLLESMIEGWRKAWGDPEMPFILAQLPNYVPTAGQGEGQWGELRDQQRQVAEKPNNNMVVLIDIGEAHDIHPWNKADVGFRMAQVALASTYGQKHTLLSPIFESTTVEGNKIRVRFKNAEEGLEAKGGNLKGFEIAGADGKYFPAQGRIEKDTVLLWNGQVPAPISVRYAWADDPIFNLYGKNGLPASPFESK